MGKLPLFIFTPFHWSGIKYNFVFEFSISMWCKLFHCILHQVGIENNQEALHCCGHIVSMKKQTPDIYFHYIFHWISTKYNLIFGFSISVMWPDNK